MMNLLKSVFLGATMLCAGNALALEVSGNNDIKSVNSGLERRFEALSSLLEASFNSLKAKVDTFDGRITTNTDNIDIIKANGAKNKVQLWNSDLEDRLSAIEADTTNIKTNGGPNKVQLWNVALENRLDALQTSITNHNTRIMALESKGNLSLVFKRAITLYQGQTSATLNYDLCTLSSVYFGTVENNHQHTCTVARSSAGFTLTASTKDAYTTCTMLCFNLE